jgi:hypothetical protein
VSINPKGLSYLIVPRKSRFESGVCEQRKMRVCIKKNGLASVISTHAFIPNGMMCGPLQPQLTLLTEMELALISLVLIFQGGPHQAVTGWHSMFTNDVNLVRCTMNWCKCVGWQRAFMGSLDE